MSDISPPVSTGQTTVAGSVERDDDAILRDHKMKNLTVSEAEDET
jgi:hypothetical protein